ncbi:MAG: YjbF family lipoprotein [Paracoccaceae bacterium]
MIRAAFIIALVLMAGCSGGQDRPNFNLEVYNAVRNAAQPKAAAVERPPLTRAVLDTLEGSFTEAVLERFDQLAYLFVEAERRDTSGRRIIVWRSEDNVSVTLRNGVLVSTHALGGDLIGAGIDQTGIGPAVGQHVRVMRFVDGGNRQVTMQFQCEVTDRGSTTITIIERAHPTRHVVEDCSGDVGQIRNEYWIDTRAGLAWQSRQWAGPEVGYIRFRRLTHNQ